MTESKRKAITTADELYALATRANKREGNKLDMSAEKDLFTSTIARKYFTKFYVGKEKIVVYGNPILMSCASTYWHNLKESGMLHPHDTHHVMTGTSVTKYPDQFVMAWSRMNGIACSSWLDTTDRFLSLDEVFYIVELMNYFGIELDEVGDKPDSNDDSGVNVQTHIMRVLESWKFIDKEKIYWINRILTLAIHLSLQKQEYWAFKLKKAVADVLKLSFEKAEAKENSDLPPLEDDIGATVMGEVD